jgi:hypothetical protein
MLVSEPPFTVTLTRRYLLLSKCLIFICLLCSVAVNAHAVSAKCAIMDRAVCTNACNRVGGRLVAHPNGSFTCTDFQWIAYRPDTSGYVSLYQIDSFATVAVNNFSNTVDSNDVVFDPPHTKADPQLGVGALLEVNRWLALNVEFGAGNGHVSLVSATRNTRGEPLAALDSDTRLTTGIVGARLYPLQTDVLRPWLSVGFRGLSVQPVGPLTARGEHPLVLRNRLEPTATTTFACGFGVQYALNRRVAVDVAADHAFGSGWRVGAAVVFTVPKRSVQLPDVLELTGDRP